MTSIDEKDLVIITLSSTPPLDTRQISERSLIELFSAQVMPTILALGFFFFINSVALIVSVVCPEREIGIITSNEMFGICKGDIHTSPPGTAIATAFSLNREAPAKPRW